MGDAEQIKTNIRDYFTHLKEKFRDNPELFEENWRGIENVDFDLDDLTTIIKEIGHFLVPDFRTRDTEGKKLTALRCVQNNLSCWENSTFTHLERLAEDPNYRPKLSNLKNMGEALDRLLLKPLPQRFAEKWQELLFRTLHAQKIDDSFTDCLKVLAGIKSKNRRKADISYENKEWLMRLIEAYTDNLEGQHLSDLIYSLNKLNIVPNRALQEKIMARAQVVLSNQIKNEENKIPAYNRQRMTGRHLSQFIFGAANMVMDWPDELFEDFKKLAQKHINKPAEAARTLHGIAMLYARTRDEKYKKFGAEFYKNKLENINLSDSGKKQVFDACFVIDIHPGFKRPAEDSAIGGESNLSAYLDKIGIPISDEPLIIQGTGHHVDIRILTEDGKRAVGIEFDGPSHFHIYFDHKNSSKTHRIYNGETLMQMMIAEKDAPDAVIVRVPHSVKLAKTEAEAEFIRSIVEKAKGDSMGRDKPAGVYIAHGKEGRGISLKSTKPINGGPMRIHYDIHF